MKKFSLGILISINVLTALGLLATGYCDRLNPNTFGWLSIMGYALPIFIIANIAMMLLWVVIKKRYIVISFLALIAAYQPVTLYCPINTATADADLPDSLITILSYNTSNWGDLTTSPDKRSTREEKITAIADMLRQVSPDILVLQESVLIDFATPITSMYQYADTIRSPYEKGVTVTLLSRYPILRKENLLIDSKRNVCGAFWLNVRGKEVIVLNAHLEVMHFSMAERSQLSTIVHGNQKDRDSIRTTSHTLIGKIYNSTKIRARQAERIAAFIRLHPDTPIIIAGDFNDIPNSYTHHTIVSALSSGSSSSLNTGSVENISSASLTDCYQSSGFGPGYTFKHFGIRERIDHIICSHHFTPYNCHTIKDITVSDHQPVTCKLKIEN